jgi:Protein of unknown function (DUF2939)
MRKLKYATLSLIVLAALFVAYPFFTAWSIREAMQSGDSDYLERKIEWDSVRASLRQSLSEVALAPAASGAPDQPETADKPGLWQRIKASVGKRALDGIVDNYVTPDGLPQLFGVRNAYREVSGEAAELRALPWYRRLADFWSRLKRAEFKTPSAFEVEMADRNDPSRHYIGLLELRGAEWKLTDLRVRMVEIPPPPDSDGDGEPG